jgi:WD40 repeat protein
MPNGNFVTVSDDQTVRIWDAETHKQISWYDLKKDLDQKNQLDADTKEASKASMGRSVDVSPDGKKIAIGMRDGSFRVYGISYDCKTFTKEFMKQESYEWIEDLKYSPDGKLLAVGSHDNKVYIYDTATMKRIAICKSSTSFITHIDWSQDSGMIRTNDGSYEILYYTAKTGV